MRMEIPVSVRSQAIRGQVIFAVDHSHYDTADTNADPNCVFPLDRLHELVEMGIVGAVAPVNYGFMGFIPDGRLLRDTTAPILAERLSNENIDAVVLTPG